MRETLLPEMTPPDVARRLGRLTAKAVIRWITDGLIAPGGRRVFLKATKVGRYYRLKREDVRAFLRVATKSTEEADKF